MNRTVLIAVLCLLAGSLGCGAEPACALTRSKDGLRADDELYEEKVRTDLDAGGADDPAGNDSQADAAPADAAPPVDAAPPLNAFTDAPPFSTITPATDSTRPHNKAGNAGFDCLQCHTGSGAPKFLIAGTVYGTKAGGVGFKGAQVRIVDPAGTELALMGTDSVGNFWLKAGTLAALPAGSKVGVRSATSTKLMAAGIGAGSCNQSNCHVPATRPVFVLD
jgi:hypothetical protein